MIYLKVKRLIDIILSFLALIILSPVFLILVIAIMTVFEMIKRYTKNN